VCPLSLAIWHTTDPMAPDAAENEHHVARFKHCDLDQADQAVSPGIPATPRNAWGGSPNVSSFCTLAVGALNRSRQPNQEKTRSPGLYRGSSGSGNFGRSRRHPALHRAGRAGASRTLSSWTRQSPRSRPRVPRCPDGTTRHRSREGPCGYAYKDPLSSRGFAIELRPAPGGAPAP